MNPNRDIAFSRVIESATTRFATVVAAYERSCDVRTSAGAIMRRVLIVDAVAGRIRTHDKVVIVLDEGNQEWICIGIILEESSVPRPVESGEVGDTHTHAQYALSTHTHDTYALVAHSHDYSAVYSAIGHDHDYETIYAALVHPHAWADITSGLPDFTTRWPAWGEVTEKPATFDPSVHNHNDLYFTEAESDVRFAPLAHSTAWTDLTGVPSAFAPSVHNHAWTDLVSGVPDFAIRWPTWGEVTDKPTTFAYTDAANIFTIGQRIETVDDPLVVTDGVNQLFKLFAGGGLVVGPYSALATTNIAGGDNTPTSQVVGNTSALSSFLMYRYSSNNTPPRIFFLKTRGASADYTAVTSGTQLGGFSFAGGNGVGAAEGAQIRSTVEVTQTGTTYTAANLAFWTSPGGSSSLVERLKIDSNGLVGINITPTSQLHVLSGAVDRVGLLVDTPASPTVDLFRVSKNASPIFWVDSNGIVNVKIENYVGAGYTSGVMNMHHSTAGFGGVYFREDDATKGGVTKRGTTNSLGNHMQIYTLGADIQMGDGLLSNYPQMLIKKTTGHVLLGKAPADVGAVNIKNAAVGEMGLVVDALASSTAANLALRYNGAPRYSTRALDTYVENRVIAYSLANDATIQLPNPIAIVEMVNVTAGNYARYFLRGGHVGTVELEDTAGQFTGVKDTAASINVYRESTYYYIQNKTGATVLLSVVLLRAHTTE